MKKWSKTRVNSRTYKQLMSLRFIWRQVKSMFMYLRKELTSSLPLQLSTRVQISKDRYIQSYATLRSLKWLPGRAM